MFVNYSRTSLIKAQSKLVWKVNKQAYSRVFCFRFHFFYFEMFWVKPNDEKVTLLSLAS